MRLVKRIKNYKNYCCIFQSFLFKNVRLSDIQNQIIKLLIENPRLNAQEISIKLEKSKKTIERAFIELQNNNIIKRAGSKRDGYWIVIE